MYQLIEYIKFIFKSTNEHGVHSPFVYKLVTKCFYDRSFKSPYNQIKSYRRNLLKNKQSLQIHDLGTGSKVFESNKRSIRNIAKISGSSFKRSKLLFRLVAYFKPKSILELGTSLGIATYSMALGNEKSDIVSIEGCPNISEFTKKNIDQFNIKNINMINGSFDEMLEGFNNKTWDMVFFDGHHNKDATLKYFENLLPNTHNNTLFIFDDIHWSKNMSLAWKIIQEHPKVVVTIDTFYWGLVFFRKEQKKEHFIIRV